MWKVLVTVLAFTLVGCVKSQPTQDELAQMAPEEINELAVKLWKNNKYTDPNLAISYADAAIQQDPNYGRAYYTKGFAYYNLKNYHESINNFSKAIELDPNIQEPYNGRGWVYLETEQYNLAIQDFSKSIEIDSSYALPINNRGYAYLQINNLEKACEDLQKACELGSCGVWKQAKKDKKCK